MKVTIAETRTKTIKIDCSLADPAKVVHTLDHKTNTRSEAEFITALTTMSKDFSAFDTAASLTGYVSGYWEHVVYCVRVGRYETLDFIFDNNLVSPDFVAHNGSPLILFAMEQGLTAFRYMVSRGARLIVDGDLVCNSQRHSVNVFSCTNVSPDKTAINKVLFNHVLVNMSSMTNAKTLSRLLAQINASRPQIKRYQDRIAELTKLEDLPAPQECDINGLVSKGCVDTDQFKEAGEGMSETVIRRALVSALSLDTLDTWYALRAAFPQHKIE